MQNEEAQRQTAKEYAEKIVKILDKKKAGDLKLLCVREKTPLADYFVICSANSSTQLRSMADEVEFVMKETYNIESRTEGRDGWILLDFASVIVHVFTREARDFYKLDKLWGDGEEINITSITEENDKEVDKQ